MNRTNPIYEPVSLGDWMITLLILQIPIVGIVMLFVWAFGANTHPSKANWAKAMLLWTAIGIVTMLIVFIAISLLYQQGL